MFISCFILMLGNGLINILLPVRMQLELMSTDTIGLVLSLYFVGMLAGSVISKSLISRAGHIRMFAGSIALAAVSILVCSLYADPVLWGAMRILIGFCNACAYTAMESWLNGASTKDTRGKILAFYNAVILGATFAGQFLINIASPTEAILFVLSGIILCLAVIPMSWSRHRGPEVTETVSMSIVALFRRSPLGVVACFTSGIVYAAVFNLIPLFASHYGIEGFDLSIYVGSATLGAFLLQFPVGYLSDRFDRRSVLLMALLLSSAVGFSIQLLADLEMFVAMSVATAISAGIIACTYPLSISETFDKLKQSEMVSAMGSLILAFSIGGMIGPYSISLLMGLFGSQTLYYQVGVVQLILAAFVVLRMRIRPALPAEDQENFVMQSGAVPASVELDPRIEYTEATMPLSPEVRTAVEIAESDPGTAVRMAKTMVQAKPEQGVDIVAEVAKVEGVDPLRLYESMLDVVPDQILEITSAMVKATPELGYELVRKLAESNPDDVVAVAAEIGRISPELRVDMARVAVESAPESALEVAEYYAQVMGDEYGAVRPADREDDTSDQAAAELVSQLSELAPEQTLDVASAIVEAVPDSAATVAAEVASNLYERQADLSDSGPETAETAITESSAESEMIANTGDESWQQDAVDLVTRLAEVAPKQAIDIGVAVVEAQPDVAVAVATEYASTISDRQSELAEADSETSVQDQGYTETIGVSDDNPEKNSVAAEAAELVSRLSDAVPEQGVDIGVAVAEALPEAAVAVATGYANALSERQSDDENDSEAVNIEIQAEWETSVDNQGDGTEQTARLEVAQEAAELVSRLADAMPEQAVDIGAAVVDALPESASDVVEALEGSDQVQSSDLVSDLDKNKRQD
nr:MFS transporter [Oceanospirillum sediminis]